MDPQEWHGDHLAICPVCQLSRGSHFDALCPTPKGTVPSYTYSSYGGKDAIPLFGPEQPRGRYGVPILYHPDGKSWFFGDPSKGAPAPTCNQVKDNVGTPINDHVCPTCRNDRCSKNTETHCWRCGNKL
jgi:hypothetical protein